MSRMIELAEADMDQSSTSDPEDSGWEIAVTLQT